MVAQYMVKPRYQGAFFWVTSKDWKNCAKSFCTTSMKKTGQTNKTKPQTKQKDSTSLTCFQQYLRFMQIIRNCHTLSRSWNTKLWAPSGWQFFFHLGCQTSFALFPHLPTPLSCLGSTFFCYAPVRQWDASLQPRVLHDARMCNLEGLLLIQSQQGMCLMGTQSWADPIPTVNTEINIFM